MKKGFLLVPMFALVLTGCTQTEEVIQEVEEYKTILPFGVITPEEIPVVEAPVVDALGFYTYTNDEFGFEVKYPQDGELVVGDNYKYLKFEDYIIFINASKTKDWGSFDDQYKQEEAWQAKIRNLSEGEVGPGHIKRSLPFKKDILINDSIAAEKIYATSPVFVDVTPWVQTIFTINDVYFNFQLAKRRDPQTDFEEQVFDQIVESLIFTK